MTKTELKAIEAKMKSMTAEIEAKASANLVARRIALLSTESGANQMLRKQDGAKLDALKTQISNITEKPVFTGFTYNTNVETIVAIAQSLQFMKGDLRDQIPEAVWSVFDADTRTELLNAYGRMPYLAEELAIEIDGKNVVVDPTAKTRAKAGIKPNIPNLVTLVNTVAMDLGLLAEYNCTQQEADTEWANALNRVHKAELLDTYKDTLAQ